MGRTSNYIYGARPVTVWGGARDAWGGARDAWGQKKPEI